MRFADFLAPTDARRVIRVLEKLAHYGLRDFALTGGLAVEMHRDCPSIRSLNDVDIVVESFDAIPPALAYGFLFRHIHPDAAHGKTMVQLVDAREALRIDVFRAYGATLARSVAGPVALVAREDLAAREAALLMDLERGIPVPRKHAEDFPRLLHTVDPGRIEAAWREHRKPHDPETFREAAALIVELLQSRQDLLVVPEYSRDTDAVCPQCRETERFRLAAPRTVLSILGYC